MISNISENKVDFKELGISNETKKKEEQSEQTQFLQLFVAQLRNQNPMEPQEGADFLAQLAQFSTVEGIKNMEKSISTLVSELGAAQTLQASSLVGKQIETRNNLADLIPGEMVKGSIDLGHAVPNLTLEVQNFAGEVLNTVQLGPQDKGQIPFAWDGKDIEGELLPGDKYKIIAKSNIDNKEQEHGVYLSSKVESITIGNDNRDVTLNVRGQGQVPIENVRTIS